MNLRQNLFQIHLLMTESLIAYQQYIHNGKTFRFAKELRKCNTEMIDLLLHDSIRQCPDLSEAAHALIEHYIIWRNKWDDLAAILKPSPDDGFVFENEHRFPKWAAKKIEEAYELINAVG